MDVAIFGDISKSMRKQQRKKLVNFIEELLDSTLVSADGNHVALGTFAKTADIHNKLNNKKLPRCRQIEEGCKRNLHS